VSIAHVEAVAAALAFLDERAGMTRQQRGGVRRRVRTSGLAVATFVHRTSREADPQLHTHCVIPNLVQRPDGSWVAIDGTPLYVWAKAAGSIYQEELRRRLSERLGVAWGPDRNGCREMLGFSEEQLERFSKRTTQIEKY
jgi:conjugative relaxase-like TrwC/TraI family protein